MMMGWSKSPEALEQFVAKVVNATLRDVWDEGYRSAMLDAPRFEGDEWGLSTNPYAEKEN